LTQIGSGAALNAAAGFPPAKVIDSAGKVVSGFASDSNGLKFGFVGESATGFVKALESMGETKVLAAPRIFVVNKQSAQIHLGDCLGYKSDVTTQTNTSQNVNFVNVGTQLAIQPFVSSDGMVRMGVHPARTTGHIDSGGVPQTSGTDVTTNVIVADGQTIVIGGLIDSEINRDWDGLPFFSRLPWIGYMFRHTVDSSTKKELVVILTPHIQRPNCPDALNYLGQPRTLGLTGRVSQSPHQEARDRPSLFDLARPEGCPPGQPQPIAGRKPVQQR
jgi:general secretion pathway protein D